MPEKIHIHLRRPLGADDPGVVAYGQYTFVDGIVTLVGEDGKPLRRGSDQLLTTRTVRGAREAPLWSAAVLAGHDARQVARMLLHQKVSSEKSGTDFNRPLRYRDSGVF